MKLNRHRKDVRLLRDSWASHGGSPVFVNIARRYQRLILMAEEGLNILGPITKCRSKAEQRVLEDAKK